ncbi:MAG: metalloregulator ArsR/SmtB family transcription factor [Bacteroidales bacterium]|jgi:aminoglycoside 6-adenylyltransferase
MDNNSCIRQQADIKQINRCKNRVSELNGSFDYLSNGLELAGNNVRLKILFLLYEEKRLCVCDISDILGMTISAVSQHLRKLKDRKLIETEREAQTIFYSLTKEYEKMLKPTYQISIIKKPSEKEFQNLINDFWWDTTYVAKCLVRDEIFYAKFMSETVIRTEYLIPLIEWHIASEHNWNITTNKYGRLFKKYLNQEMWAKTEQTFSGSDIKENWTALFSMTDLVSEIGTELSKKLEYKYPDKLENDIRKYLAGLKPKT